MNNCLLSIVVPVMNEEENIKPLVLAIKKNVKNIVYEIIFVDDGSLDNTVEAILKLKDKSITLIQFSRNFGQTSALAAGIGRAQGKYIATIDGDLQNDPSDLLLMLKKLEKERLDLVVGYRAKRQDNIISRKLPSKIANFIIRKLAKINIKDIGCTIKVFKAQLAKNLDLYGELHRMIPILAAMQGAKIGEISVKHHARKFGQSKYGINRTFKVLGDLLTLLFLQRYLQKPMYLFGGIGVIFLLVGSGISFYLLMLKLCGYDIGQRPLFYTGIFLLTVAIQFITIGLLAETLTRTYYAANKKKPYIISNVYIADKKTEYKHEKESKNY